LLTRARFANATGRVLASVALFRYWHMPAHSALVCSAQSASDCLFGNIKHYNTIGE
jgi:hypothetical protein